MTIKSTLQTYEIDYKAYCYLFISVFVSPQTFIALMVFYPPETNSVTDGT